MRCQPTLHGCAMAWFLDRKSLQTDNLRAVLLILGVEFN